MRQPRPYQLAAIEAVRAAFRRGVRGVAIEQATGTCKGAEIAYIARDAMVKGSRVLVLVNRDNLVEQLNSSLIEQGLYPRIERAMDKASPMSSLVVGSIQTLQKERLQKWGRNHFNLVITDEAHFAAADTFKNTLSHFSASYHVFFSATIERHDKAGLWAGVQEVVYSYPLTQAIEDGWLVPFEFEELPVPIVVSDKEATKKMWTEKDETNLFSTNNSLPRLFAESASRVTDKHALMFWPNCDASKEADKHFRDIGMETRHVDGYMTKNAITDVLDWFRIPGPKALHNADLLSYGYDNPIVDCVGIMRLQRSIPMLKQRLGRGTRPACIVDGLESAEARRAAIAGSHKPSCRVLDLMLQLGDVKNTFADSTALITADPEEREYIREENRKAGRPLTMDEIEGKLKAKRVTDKEKQLAKLCEDAANAAEKAKYKRNGKAVFVADILQQFNPNHKPASPKFVWFVRKLAKDNATDIGAGPFSAFQLIRIKERIEAMKGTAV